jgi:hypothetical protein
VARVEPGYTIEGMAMTREWKSGALAVLVAAGASMAVAWGCGGGGGKATPIRGDKRTELCGSLKQAPEFRCPTGTNRRGKPPPEGNEMWCQRWDGTRHGSYRRFPSGSAAGAAAPAFASDGTVIGEYREGEQQGAWFTWREGAGQTNVAYYEDGKMVQRVHCRP